MRAILPRRTRRRWLIGCGLLAGLAVGAWAVEYPSGDAKSIQYVLWKAGLPTLDVAVALDTMVQDDRANALVVGKSTQELERRFGPLTPAAGASPYLRGCYEGSPWHGRPVKFIRDSAWMVVFAGDRATDLVLVKGC